MKRTLSRIGLVSVAMGLWMVLFMGLTFAEEAKAPAAEAPKVEAPAAAPAPAAPAAAAPAPKLPTYFTATSDDTKKPPAWPDRKIKKTGRAPAGNRVLHEISAVTRNLADQMVDAFNGVVQQITTQPTNGPVHQQLVMWIDPAPFGFPFTPKPRAPVGIPVTMPDPAPAAERTTGKVAGRKTRAGCFIFEEPRDALTQFVGYDLV